ncbi:MAG: tRNA pseudouridine(55) synthase TruB [Candidatus Spyradocola sp.]
MTDGFLNLLKPPGMTSSDAVVMVRKTLPKGAKVGHMGTLDPEAAGVLPIGIGTATRLFDYVSDKQKTYRAEVCVGAATDTQDATGAVTQRGSGVSEAQFLAVLPRFIGNVEQVPSMYSAIKVDGRKLYQAARAGQDVAVPVRTVRIDAIDYIAQTGENRFLIDVHCGRGTYIRTLCHDIGRALGTCAHMSFLLRTQSGVFSMDGAVTPEEFLAGNATLLPCDAPLSHIARVTVSEKLERAVRNGNAIRMEGWKQRFDEGTLLRVYLGGRFAGMGVAQEGAIRFKCMLLR